MVRPTPTLADKSRTALTALALPEVPRGARLSQAEEAPAEVDPSPPHEAEDPLRGLLQLAPSFRRLVVDLPAQRSTTAPTPRGWGG